MQGQQGRTWFPARTNGGPGVPRGYAVETGTGRLVPLEPMQPRPQARPVRKGG